MENNIKQVYSVLKMDDGILQILTAEFFNTRFNIINFHSVELEGLKNYVIQDKEKLNNCLKKAIDYVSNKIGAKLEKVILVLPPINYSRLSLRVSIVPTDGILKKTDIARALTNALKTKVDENSLVISTNIQKYYINGITTRRFQENELCDKAEIDVDLLCGDKAMAYAYVDAVYKAGLEVLDLSFDNYNVAKESSQLDNSINQNIILLDIEKSCTYLSLLAKGKLVSTQVENEGMNNFTNVIYDKYYLNNDIILRLIKYNVDFQSEHLDDPIYAWSVDSKAMSINVRELNSLIEKPLNDYVNKIVNICRPIIDEGASIFIYGEGGSMKALIDCFKEKVNCEVKPYFVDALGIRNANACGLYGALFSYKEKADLNELNVNCVNMLEYEKLISKIEVNVEGESITSKIKNLFEMYKGKEEN